MNVVVKFDKILLIIYSVPKFVEDRLEMLNSGKGLNDIFEEEVTFYAGKGGAKFKMQYKEWLGNFKVSG